MSLAGKISHLQGWKHTATAFAAGAVGVPALAPFHLWPLLFATLPVLVWLLDGLAERQPNDTLSLMKKAALTGWAFGFGYFLFGLYWIGGAFLVEGGAIALLMPLAMTIMPAALALFYGIAIALAVLYWKPGLSRILTLAIALALAEWLRGHIFTGFPWNALGQVFAGEAGLSQLSSVFGPYSLSFIAVLIFASPAAAPHNTAAVPAGRKKLLPADIKPFLLAMTTLLFAMSWGHWRLWNAHDRTVPGIQLRLVQPNIPQRDKWKPGNAGRIYQTMLKLSGTYTDKASLKEITHLIWPETALPFFMARSQEALAGIERLLPENVTLITGAIRSRNRPGSRVVYNSLMVFDAGARITHVYDKKHLVPFGEYLPFQDLLESIGLRKLVEVRGRFETGTAPRFLRLADIPPFAPLICYEVIFPEEITEPGERPQWLLNVTNDAWYGMSTGPWQHFLQSRIRAIEQGLPMIRVANTGISGIIDPYGRVLRSLSLGRSGVIDAPLPASIGKTIYSRYGKELFWLVLLTALLVILALKNPPKSDIHRV